MSQTRRSDYARTRQAFVRRATTDHWSVCEDQRIWRLLSEMIGLRRAHDAQAAAAAGATPFNPFRQSPTRGESHAAAVEAVAMLEAVRAKLEHSDVREYQFSSVDYSGPVPSITASSDQEAVQKLAKEHGQTLIGFDFSGLDLRGLRLPDAVIVDCRFTRSLLNDVDLTGARIARTAFPLVSMTGARLDQAIVQDVDFRNANLDRLQAEHATFQSCNFDHARLREAHLRHTRASVVDLVEADLTGADLRATSVGPVDIRGCVLDRARLFGLRLTEPDFVVQTDAQYHAIEQRVAEIDASTDDPPRPEADAHGIMQFDELVTR